MKRADARRNVEAIVAAATECLARDPQVSISEIATAAGVGRVTLYGHFGTRAELIKEVVRRAVADTEQSLGAIDLSGDPAAALTRLLEATWRLTHRFGGLVVAGVSELLPEEVQQVHEQPSSRVAKLLRRGRRDHTFRTDMPVRWQVTAIQGIVHAASAAVHRGDLDERDAARLVAATALAAVTAGP